MLAASSRKHLVRGPAWAARRSARDVRAGTEERVASLTELTTTTKD